jgi:hypothetical protein
MSTNGGLYEEFDVAEQLIEWFKKQINRLKNKRIWKNE